jgi:hypothetical protein
VHTDIENADVIWCSHTLEHVPNPDKIIATMRQKAKWVIVLVPPFAGGEKDLTHYLAEPVQEWLARVPVPAVQVGFQTVRCDENAPERRTVLKEDSLLMIWRGDEA